MNGVHDMGGMHGFGPIPIEADEPVFHEPWEGHVYALGPAISIPLYASIDASRYALETQPPAQYLAASYYERWLRRAETRVVELGIIEADELAERLKYFMDHPDAPVPHGESDASMGRAQARFARAPRLHRPDGAPPRFAVGDHIRTRNNHPAGHTRLPRYARGKLGVIHRVHGCHDLPDALAQGADPRPQGAYSVRFEAAELWGTDADPKGAVYIDLWDSYLDPANA